MEIEIRCPLCKGKKLIKKGRVKTKFGSKQIYYCRDCSKRFADRRLSHKTYGPKVITAALSYYNLGHTLEDSARLVNKRYKVKVSKSSVHQWLKEFKDICTYPRIRKKALKDYGRRILISKTFEHNGLNYNFRYHKVKLALFAKNLPGLAKYIKDFEKGCPDFFQEDERCSQLKIDINIKKENRYSQVSKLAGLALKAARTNKQRHSLVERFMLINDSSTVACEVPVWLWEKNLDLGIAGHIDLLQIKDGLVYILDFKPAANRENCQKVASQLYFYASGLSFRARVPLNRFRCAWFDEKAYFEFKPREAKVRFAGSKWRSVQRQQIESKN